MHLALKAYQELLLTINEMDSSPDENIRQSSNVIKSEPLTVVPQSHRLNPLPALNVLLPSAPFLRQHILHDGIQGDFPDLAEEV